MKKLFVSFNYIHNTKNKQYKGFGSTVLDFGPVRDGEDLKALKEAVIKLVESELGFSDSNVAIINWRRCE